MTDSRYRFTIAMFGACACVRLRYGVRLSKQMMPLVLKDPDMYVLCMPGLGFDLLRLAWPEVAPERFITQNMGECGVALSGHACECTMLACRVCTWACVCTCQYTRL
jgi:hypothetical protein